MSMYASKKINTDPQPYQIYVRDRDGIGYYAGHGSADPIDEPGRYTVHAPRGYYDNNSNPILVAFREDLPHALVPFGTTQEAAKWWLQISDYRDVMEEGFSPEHIDHARKVLARLASLPAL